MSAIKFDCIKIKQPIGEFFVGSIDSATLCEITFSDVRRIEKERDIETYLGIQRQLDQTRVKQIAQYVETVDACFPTAVILAIDGSLVEYDQANKQMLIKTETLEGEKIDRTKIAKVLDGQHRIEGLKDYKNGDFQVNISIFIDIDVAEQAYIFSTVNLAQTKVNKSLAYDLYELAKSRSPEKLCHSIAVTLNEEDGSPFFKRIKRLGVATDGIFTETITQATFVNSLIKYISKNPLQDRDVYQRGGIPEIATGKELNTLIFRNLMIANKDYELTDILWNYFCAVRNRWPAAWDEGGQGMILNRTNGFKALMRFLKDAYLYLVEPGGIPTEEQFLEVFQKMTLVDNDFIIQNYRPGSSGEADLYHSLYAQSGIDPQTNLIG